MTVAKYTNMGTAQLGANINTVDTTLTLADPLDINKFPSIAESWDYFRIALRNVAGDYELMKVTAIVGSTFTVERAIEGTTAHNWVENDGIRENATADFLTEIRAEGAGGEVTEMSVDFTLTPEHANKTIQITSGSTITLNPMVDFKSFSRLMIKNSSGEEVTLVPDGLETIDGKTSLSLKGKHSIEIYKGTAGWEIKNLSKTSAATTGKKYIQGLLLSRVDVDSVVLGNGICSDSNGSLDLEVSSPMTADINHEIGLGDGGMPITVAKSGTFSSVGTAIIGVGTAFTTEFKVNDVLYSSSNNEAHVVVAVLSDTQMVIQLAFTVDVASDAVQKNGLAMFATYHAILAYNPIADTNKLVFDTQINAENALADTEMTDYTVYRRVGSIMTDATMGVVDFTVTETAGGGIECIFKNCILEYSGNLPSSYEEINLTVPLGVKVKPILAYLTRTTLGNADVYIYIKGNGFEGHVINATQVGGNINGASGIRDSSYYTETASFEYKDNGGSSGATAIYNNGFIEERIL